jgi:hypothetical protein
LSNTGDLKKIRDQRFLGLPATLSVYKPTLPANETTLSRKKKQQKCPEIGSPAQSCHIVPLNKVNLKDKTLSPY